MLVQLEAGDRRVTGLSLDTEEAFETPFTRRDNPHRAYITIIEGCDKSCAYCVVPFTRGPERSRTSESVLREARELARMRLYRNPVAGPERQQLSRSVAGRLGFCAAAARVGEVDGIRRVRFTTSHPRDFVKEIVDAIDDNPVLCNHVHLPVQSGLQRVLERMQRLYTRDEYMRRIEWMKKARRNISITTDIIVGFPGETEAEFEADAGAAGRSGIRFDVQLQVLAPPEYRGAAAGRSHAARKKRAAGWRFVQEKQRAIQIRRNSELVGSVEEAFVEGYNQATGQWIGRTIAEPHAQFRSSGASGSQKTERRWPASFWNVRVTRAGPNSLAGEVVNGV